MARQSNSPAPPPPSQPFWTLVVRLFWAMIGPGVLAILLLLMAMQKEAWVEGIDVVFIVVLLLLIVTRWIDFVYADQTLMTGEIATASQIRKHSILAVIFGLVTWVIATALGIYVPG